MAYRTEHRGEFRLALRRATSLPRGNKCDYVSYKTLVRWRFACALRGSARGFWFIDPLGLRPRGLCTVSTCARHVNHVPPDRRIRSCKCTQKWMFYLFATILILLYSATFPAAILSSPMTVDSISVYSHVVFTHLHILIVTVKLNVWHLHRSIIAMFVQLHFFLWYSYCMCFVSVQDT